MKLKCCNCGAILNASYEPFICKHCNCSLNIKDANYESRDFDKDFWKHKWSPVLGILFGIFIISNTFIEFLNEVPMLDISGIAISSRWVVLMVTAIPLLILGTIINENTHSNRTHVVYETERKSNQS